MRKPILWSLYPQLENHCRITRVREELRSFEMFLDRLEFIIVDKLYALRKWWNVLKKRWITGEVQFTMRWYLELSQNSFYPEE